MKIALFMHLLTHLAVPVPWSAEVRWNATGGVTVVCLAAVRRRTDSPANRGEWGAPSFSGG